MFEEDEAPESLVSALLACSTGVEVSDTRISISLEELTLEKPVLLEKEEIEIVTTCQTKVTCPLIIIKGRKISVKGFLFHSSVRFVECQESVLEDCEFQSPPAGPESACKLVGRSQVVIQNVKICNVGDKSALTVSGHSSAKCTNVHLESGTETLLVVNDESTVDISDSKIIGTEANGVFCNRNSTLFMKNCAIRRTKYPAIYVLGGACQVSHCELSGIEQNAISMNQCREFVIEDNTLESIEGSAIAVLDESKGVVRNNTVKKVAGNGVFVSTGSDVDIQGNKLLSNVYPGIAVLVGSSAWLLENVVAGVVYSGICCRGAKHITIEKCQVSNSQDCGISVSDTALCEIRNCEFLSCDAAAVESYNSAVVKVSDCILKDIKEWGFSAYACGQIHATNNTAERISGGLCRLRCRGSGFVSDTKCVEVKELVKAETTGDFVFYRNGSFRNTASKIELVPEGVGDVEILPEWVDPYKGLCLKCHKAPRECFLVDCGHMVYCQKCCDEAKEKKENCPLCRFPIAKGVVGYCSSLDDQCVICSENPASCVILPCGHTGYCRECLEKWYKNQRTCPTCRHEPSNFKVIVRDL